MRRGSTVPLSLALDILVAFLLVLTIGYAMVLNRRLRGLRRDKAELEKMVASFGAATARAEESIGKLKATANDLKGKVDAAQALHDDLAFLVERGGATADRLEEGVRAARPGRDGGRRAGAGKATNGGELRGAPPKSDAERELLRALRAAR